VSEEQVIVAVGVTQEANDVQQLKPMRERLEQTLEAAGIEERPRTLLGDAGYWSETNIRSCSSLPPRTGSSGRRCERGVAPAGVSSRG